MKREELEKLGLEKEAIDKIMALHGKSITILKEENNTLKEDVLDLKGEITTHKTTIKDLETGASQFKETQTELDTLKQSIAEKEAEEQKKAEEQTFNEEFDKLIGDKKFINDYTKQAIINEFKTALSDETNKGKEKLDVLNEMTKDKEGIFASPNKITDIPPAGEVDKTSTDKKEIPLIW